jgi:fructosamine-3-kinase
VAAQPIGGGCIASAYRATLASGRTLFAKQATNLPTDAFRCEAAGLQALRACDSLHIPQLIAVDDDMLVLEWIDPAIPNEDFMSAFGRAFAALHRIQGDHFGFEHDNYLGRTQQPNTTRTTSWPQFYFSQRIEYQLKLAEANGFADQALRQAVHKLESSIHQLLADSQEPPCLLHGDLWSGNFLIGPKNRPTLIDPAVYYGHREADLAMTRIFGGFSPEFYTAYEQAYPLPPGERRRRPLYEAWHLLNHLNLFGASYYQQALAALMACS